MAEKLVIKILYENFIERIFLREFKVYLIEQYLDKKNIMKKLNANLRLIIK